MSPVSRNCGMGRTVGLSETQYGGIYLGYYLCPGLWEGKDSGTEWDTVQWDMSGIFPVSWDCGMGTEWNSVQWDMSGIFPLSWDCGMGRTVGPSETQYNGTCSQYPKTVGWEGQWDWVRLSTGQYVCQYHRTVGWEEEWDWVGLSTVGYSWDIPSIAGLWDGKYSRICISGTVG